MALIEPFMVKTSLGTGADTAVELEAKTGESLLVKDVIIHGSDDTYALLEVEKTTVGFFRVDGHSLGSHLPAPQALVSGSQNLRGMLAGGSITLLAYMIKKGWMRGYPVAEGQTFRVKPYTSGKKLGNVIIIYEKYDAGDIKSTDENGSESKRYVFVNYGQSETHLAAPGDYEINVCKTTHEFPNFPFGESVPSKTVVEILAILGSESIDYEDATCYTYTKYLKMFKGRTCLFDEDKNGLPFYHPTFSGISAGTHFGRGFSIIGNYSAYDRREPFILPSPLTFKEGEEVKMFITVDKGESGACIPAVYSEIAIIERVTIME